MWANLQAYNYELKVRYIDPQVLCNLAHSYLISCEPIMRQVKMGRSITLSSLFTSSNTIMVTTTFKDVGKTSYNPCWKNDGNSKTIEKT